MKMQKCVKRGSVMMNGKCYFSLKLLDFEGEAVFVKAENDQQMKVFDASGALICTAKMDESRRSNLPTSLKSLAEMPQSL